MSTPIDDPDYARLSLICGIICRQMDDFLGRSYFIVKARAHPWELTQAMLDDWKAEGRAMGVPVALMEVPAEIEKRLDSYVQLGMRLQAPR